MVETAGASSYFANLENHLVHDLGCRAAEHSLGANIEDLDHTFLVGGDA
jgi:hypothetical protein